MPGVTPPRRSIPSQNDGCHSHIDTKYKDKEDYLLVLKKNYMLIRDHRQLYDEQAMAAKQHKKAQKTQ